MENKYDPGIEIKFLDTILIPKNYFQDGQILDESKEWTPEKAKFFGPHIISSLEITPRELKKWQ